MHMRFVTITKSRSAVPVAQHLLGIEAFEQTSAHKGAQDAPTGLLSPPRDYDFAGLAQ